MKHWYTTLFGVLASVAPLAHSLGVPAVGHVGSTDFLTLISGLGVAGLGLSAADAAKTVSKQSLKSILAVMFLLLVPSLLHAQNECAAVVPAGTPFSVIKKAIDSSGIRHDAQCQAATTGKTYYTSWNVISSVALTPDWNTLTFPLATNIATFGSTKIMEITDSGGHVAFALIPPGAVGYTGLSAVIDVFDSTFTIGGALNAFTNSQSCFGLTFDLGLIEWSNVSGPATFCTGMVGTQKTTAFDVGFENTTPAALDNSKKVVNTTAMNVQAGPTYNHSAVQKTSPHTVVDTCTLGTSCAVTLTGAAVYTSSASYVCNAVDATAIAAVRFVPSSGSAFTFTGTGTDVLDYVCQGN
jgi:hypothetical protein